MCKSGGDWFLVWPSAASEQLTDETATEGPVVNVNSLANLIVVAKYCDRSHKVLPASMYFAHGEVDVLYDELTQRPNAPNHVYPTQQPSGAEDRCDSDKHSKPISGIDDDFGEKEVDSDDKEKKTRLIASGARGTRPSPPSSRRTVH